MMGCIKVVCWSIYILTGSDQKEMGPTPLKKILCIYTLSTKLIIETKCNLLIVTTTRLLFLVMRKINKPLSALPYIKQMLSTCGLNSNKYFSLAEFEGCTVSYEPCFFLLQ